MNNIHLTVLEARDIAGSLSSPSKMPGWGYGLPARECITGSKLRKIKNSVCSACYAFRGNYGYPVVTRAQYNRFSSLDNPAWVEAMVALIIDSSDSHFRWHDSGDIQSVEHLCKIIEVCRATPTIKHWLPTREYGIVRAWRRAGGRVPGNLCIRLSAHMIDGPLPRTISGIQISSVSTGEDMYPKAHQCPSRFQNNKCRDCRACWNKDVPHVSYHKH